MKSIALTEPPGSEFDEFLYAPIAEEHNGTLLSVLSALARVNVDPWDEAARLARLPREAATQFLTALIVALPDGPSTRTDPEAIVERLIGLLPKRVASEGNSPNVQPIARAAGRHHALIGSWVLYIAVMLLLLVHQWLTGHTSQETAPAGAAASAGTGAASTHAPAP